MRKLSASPEDPLLPLFPPLRPPRALPVGFPSVHRRGFPFPPFPAWISRAATREISGLVGETTGTRTRTRTSRSSRFNRRDSCRGQLSSIADQSRNTDPPRVMTTTMVGNLVSIIVGCWSRTHRRGDRSARDSARRSVDPVSSLDLTYIHFDSLHFALSHLTSARARAHVSHPRGSGGLLFAFT